MDDDTPSQFLSDAVRGALLFALAGAALAVGLAARMWLYGGLVGPLGGGW